MKFNATLLSLALVVSSMSLARAQDGLGPLQGRTEKLANEAGSAVIGLGQPNRAGRNATVADVLDSQAGGAGFVIDEEGRILTASSLVPNRGRVEVYFKGHHRAMANVLARDPRTHVALLQLVDVRAVVRELGTSKLPFLKLGRSADLKLGRVVATVGNPYNSLQVDGVAAFSLGVVSAMGRVRDADNYKGQAIETDAAVNPGSYGGPLVDLDGRAVGVVIEPVSTKRWLGIAVPIDEVVPILGDLEAGRSPAPPHLGLAVASSGEASLEGLRISEVEVGGPAANAGLKAGDMLLTLDGAKVVEAFDIERELGLLSQGTPVEIGVVRDGKRVLVQVTLGAAMTLTDVPPRADGKPYLGIKAEDRDGGVYVTEIVEDGPAGKSKLSPGVKINSFNDVLVTKKQDMIDALAKLSPGDKVTLKVENSEGFHKTVTIVLGTKGGDAAPPRSQEKPEKHSNKPAFFGVGCGKPDDDDQAGLVVQRVLAGSAAEKAKIQVGDFILELDGQKMTEFTDFTKVIQSKVPGDTVKVKLSRGGKERELTVTLGEKPDNLDQQGPPPREEEKPAPKRPWVGFALVEKSGKIVVEDVADGSPAADAKIKVGFAIVGAEDQDKITIDKLAQLIESKKIGDKLTLKVENDEGWTKTVTLTLGERPKDK